MNIYKLVSLVFDDADILEMELHQIRNFLKDFPLIPGCPLPYFQFVTSVVTFPEIFF